MNSLLENAKEVPSSITSPPKVQEIDISKVKDLLQNIAKQSDCIDQFNLGGLYGHTPTLQNVILCVLESYKMDIDSVEKKTEISTFMKALDTLFQYSKIKIDEQKLVSILSGYISAFYEKYK